MAVHCGSIRQTATILSMDKDCLRTGDKATVHFRFIKTPEYLHIDQRLVFREGRTKAVGTITKVWPGRLHLPPANPGGHFSSRPRAQQVLLEKPCGITQIARGRGASPWLRRAGTSHPSWVIALEIPDSHTPDVSSC